MLHSLYIIMRVKRKWQLLFKTGVAAKGEKERREEIVKKLLHNRDFKTKKQIQEFLNPVDPYKLTAGYLGIDPKQVAKAVARIKKAIKNNEKIIVYGDYDTDGVCATAILWETLNSLKAKAMPFIPRREQGYGLKVEVIDQLKKEGVGLIITVDQGIVAHTQVKHAQKLGIDVVVTDHHLPGKEKPKAMAIVHTTQLCGAGVSWFLSTCLSKKVGLDLVTIGTITDMMPLTVANRSIVKHGLNSLRKTKRPGLLALYEIAGIDKEKIGTYEIGFLIGPRLNVSGRLDDPMDTLRLVCTKDEQRASVLARQINEKNQKRQKLTDEAFFHARGLWLAQDKKGKLIFIAHESYEEGVVGLVAGKMLEEFYRPAIIITRGEKYSRASARSISGFNIVDALRLSDDILSSHGGHPLAAGFTIETEKLDELEKRLKSLADQQLDEEKLTPTLKIDLELNLSDLSFALFERLQEFEPFGFGNPEPVFLSRNLTVGDTRLVGNSSQHLKLRLSSGDPALVFEAIAFGVDDETKRLKKGDKVDAVYNFDENEWNGTTNLQLRVKALRISPGLRHD